MAITRTQIASVVWKIFRAVVSALLLAAVLLPVSLYVLLSIDPVQNEIRSFGSKELSRLLGADVKIGRVMIHPFNKLDIRDVSLSVGNDTIARLDRVSAAFELMYFLRTRRFVIDYAYVDGMYAGISRETPDSPLNIQTIIEHLKSDKPREEKPFDLEITTVIIRNASASYDVLSASQPDSAKFCPQHIAVHNLAVNAYIPRISNNRYQVHLDHLSFCERSGFELKALHAKADFGRSGARLYDFSLELPESRLAFEPLELSFSGYEDMPRALREETVVINTTGTNTVYLPDLRAFAPVLEDFDCHASLVLGAEGSLDNVHINTLAIRDGRGRAFSLSASGNVVHPANRDDMSYTLEHAKLNFDGRDIVRIFHKILPENASGLLSQVPDYNIELSASGTVSNGMASVKAFGTPGTISAKARYSGSNRNYTFTGNLSTENLNLGLLTGNSTLGMLTADIDGSACSGRKPSADIKAQISCLGYNGYDYRGIKAALKMSGGKRVEADFSLNDPAARLLAYCVYDNSEGLHNISGTATASEIDLHKLGIVKEKEGYLLSAKMNVQGACSSIDDISGIAGLYDIRWLDRYGRGIRVSKVELSANPTADVPTLSIDSDVLKGNISGTYTLSTLPEQLQAMVTHFMPALILAKQTQPSKKHRGDNDFHFDFKLLSSEALTEFLGIPFHVMYDIDIDGAVNSRRGMAVVNVDAPYLRQGKKLYENTSVLASLDTARESSRIYLTTQFGTKKGEMALSGLLTAANNRVDTHVDWTIERAIPINGTLGFSTLLRNKPGKTADGPFPLDARIEFNPGTINFGDETWKIQSSAIDITPAKIEVDNFRLATTTQTIDIDGLIGNGEFDNLAVALDSISLLPIFETLEIDNALLSGRATGVFTARNLLGDEPYFACDNLHVDSIGYQRCTMGDAEIKAAWDNRLRAFTLDADITGENGRLSRVDGAIFPFDEALDIDFYADSIPVDFLRPFMVAFTSSITGRASGHCRLFGTFRDIDLEGDVYADNVKLKVDFTGTSYTASDSIHITPGKIDLDNIVIRDSEGHTALLNGWVRHQCFHLPSFRFDIKDAHDFLSYNITSRDNPDWYGTIYGNGGASISGEPGEVNISVAMSTAPRSTFTFVLSDRLDAEDYSFLTFRDATPDSLRVEKQVFDDTPEAVRAFRTKAATGDDTPSKYNMDIRVDVTRDAAMTLVMDPVGGDEIKARGEGNLRLVYRSANNDLNIWGKYTLNDGSYRFTLQDIIIKEFTIKEGSEIRFDGDPYAVKTDIEAYYATNANLSDLDKSFTEDKELARTNVPVHALMKVTGDVRQPAIDFDLEFPTLTSDVYRKVRSIVSTSDMVNRQIIYLLALNRFYTPDYMASTTKGSELFSVASSTISGQLGNMLGKLSDNWSIAPNLRSDRGDFSDVEVDVALSSRLLNNRLLFNGNFGYRDKALNSNQFIGDFDIEYLLNRRGTWRLKAYNRYNDRNYYIRSAQTTQGLGIIFRRDFDSLTSFLRRKKKDTSAEPEVPEKEK
ncbi:MAG: translocation/assembly module TamB [Muribaculaceae bacterium]|jgi:hypothetical protein|nr:translocation/assembly module TamB [Muribaculaceae bacterium]